MVINNSLLFHQTRHTTITWPIWILLLLTTDHHLTCATKRLLFSLQADDGDDNGRTVSSSTRFWIAVSDLIFNVQKVQNAAFLSSSYHLINIVLLPHRLFFNFFFFHSVIVWFGPPSNCCCCYVTKTYFFLPSETHLISFLLFLSRPRSLLYQLDTHNQTEMVSISLKLNIICWFIIKIGFQNVKWIRPRAHSNGQRRYKRGIFHHGGRSLSNNLNRMNLNEFFFYFLSSVSLCFHFCWLFFELA